MTRFIAKYLQWDIAICCIISILLIFSTNYVNATSACSRRSVIFVAPKVQSFLIRPFGLLERYPLGGDGLSSEVRSLLEGDFQTTIRHMSELIKKANINQKRAIADGLTGAIDICSSSYPDIARQMIEFANRLQDIQFRVEFYRDRTQNNSAASVNEESVPKGRLLDNNPFAAAKSPFAPIK